MGEMGWSEAVELIIPHVYKINTEDGFGTGFYISGSEGGEIGGIATAAHVVSQAHAWKQPIKLQRAETREEYFINDPERAIVINEDLDTAIILVDKEQVNCPDKLLSLSPEGKILKIGNEIGWIGFPALSPENLCFFSGRVSTYLRTRNAYLVDGVAINGVSGGPAFKIGPDKSITIIGLVSAYIPNTATNEILPGLCLLSDVIQLQQIARAFKSFDQAKKEESKQSKVTIPKFVEK